MISFSTLVAAIIFLCTDISLEAYLGAIISLIIIKSGCDMMRETLSRLLGERVDADIAKAIGKTIMEFPTVHGVYDLVVSFDAKDRHAVFDEVKAAIQQKFPEYQINMAMDTDFISS